MNLNATQHAFFCSDELWNSLINLASSKGQSIDDVIVEAVQTMLQKEGMGGLADNNPALSVNPSPNSAPASIQQAQSAVPPIPPPQPYSRQPIPPHQGRQGSSYNHPQVPPSFNDAPSIPSSLYGSSQPAPLAHHTNPSQSIPPAPPIQSYSSAVQNMQPPAANSYRRSPSNYDAPAAYSMDPARIKSASAMPAAQSHLNNGYQAPQNIPAQPLMQMTGQPPLYIVFANQRYTVDKDKFIIGRSSQLADLVIRDGNISRKHCAIIYKGGAYYIKDLDSTNGIEYKGQRIDTKRIDEGDVFNICEFQFTFTYRQA